VEDVGAGKDEADDAGSEGVLERRYEDVKRLERTASKGSFSDGLCGLDAIVSGGVAGYDIVWR
jgi:hypothetical protein